jgi:hypothetical protein
MRYTKAENIKDCVDKAIKGYQKGRNGVQNAAVNVLIHAAKTGDYTEASRLCEGVGNKSLVSWFEDFGGLTVEGKSFKGWKGAEYIRKNLTPAKGEKQGAAQRQMYWEYKAQDIWGGQDDEKALRSFLNKHYKAVKMVEESPELAAKAVFNHELVTAVETALAAHSEAA